MITKKKLKTKVDYQIRTFGISVVLIFLFTFFAINPRITDVRVNNEETITQIEEQEALNATLEEEYEYNTSKITIKND